MNVALGDDAVERRCDAQVCFQLRDRSHRLTRRLRRLLRRRELTLIGFNRFLRDNHIVAGHHARRGRRGFQTLERARVRVSLGAGTRQLRFSGLQLRLRFRALRDQLGRLEFRHQFTGPDARSSIDANAFDERRHLRVDRDGFEGIELPGHVERHRGALLDDAHDVDRRRTSGRRGLVALWRGLPGARGEADREQDAGNGSDVTACTGTRTIHIHVLRPESAFWIVGIQ